MLSTDQWNMVVKYSHSAWVHIEDKSSVTNSLTINIQTTPKFSDFVSHYPAVLMDSFQSELQLETNYRHSKAVVSFWAFLIASVPHCQISITLNLEKLYNVYRCLHKV